MQIALRYAEDDVTISQKKNYFHPLKVFRNDGLNIDINPYINIKNARVLLFAK